MNALLNGNLLAQHAPGHVRPQFLAPHNITLERRFALDRRAILGRDAVLQPALHRLVSAVLDVEQTGSTARTPQNVDRPFGGRLGRSFDFHAPIIRKIICTWQEFFAFPEPSAHEKLAAMSIHDAIKARRVELGLSQEALALLVSKQQPGEKPTSRQTVQHWENGTAAPKRTRMPAVAAALEISVEALMAGDKTTDQQRAQALMSELIRLLGKLTPDQKAQLTQPDGLINDPSHNFGEAGDSHLGGLDDLAKAPPQRGGGPKR